MTQETSCPIIEHIKWDIIDVEGLGTFKDVKLWPGGGRAWDWEETQTRHVPGIQVADVKELVGHGAEAIVLSRGMDLVLQTCPETIEFLRTEQITAHVLETREAVRVYNSLCASGQKVAGLFHSTC
jgi:hypothetical protein